MTNCMKCASNFFTSSFVLFRNKLVSLMWEKLLTHPRFIAEFLLEFVFLNLLGLVKSVYQSLHIISWFLNRIDDYKELIGPRAPNCEVEIIATYNSRISSKVGLLWYNLLTHIWRQLCSNWCNNNPVLFSSNVNYRTIFFIGVVLLSTTRSVPYVDQDMLLLSKHMKSPTVLLGLVLFSLKFLCYVSCTLFLSFCHGIITDVRRMGFRIPFVFLSLHRLMVQPFRI